MERMSEADSVIAQVVPKASFVEHVEAFVQGMNDIDALL